MRVVPLYKTQQPTLLHEIDGGIHPIPIYRKVVDLTNTGAHIE
jgi:hypothetical protein